jgi:hypothetical protein
MKTGLACASVVFRFRITANKKDAVLLYMIKTYFNCGSISKIDLRDCLDFTVSDQNSISNIIIPFFKNYPLRGTKLLDFLDWAKCFEIVKKKEHLTTEGLNKIRFIKGSLNSRRIYNKDELSSAIELLRKINSEFVELNPNYISGFLVGDGYLSLISKIDSPSFGKIKIGFTQHANNLLLLQSIKDYLNIENLVISNTGEKAISLNCGSKQTVTQILLPFFEKYPLYGVKAITLRKLLKITDLIKSSSNSITRKTTNWTPDLKVQVLNIWGNSSFILKGDATVAFQVD